MHFATLTCASILLQSCLCTEKHNFGSCADVPVLKLQCAATLEFEKVCIAAMSRQIWRFALDVRLMGRPDSGIRIAGVNSTEGLSKILGIQTIAFQIDIGLLFDVCFEESLPGMHVTVSRLQ
jgi:hypothetical protein